VARAVVACVLVLACCCGDSRASDPGADAYTIDSAAESVVVEITSRGGLGGGGSRTVLFGDGRIEHFEFDIRGLAQDTLETNLRTAEIADLVDAVVSSGAARLGTEGLASKLEEEIQLKGLVPVEGDAATVTISVHFESYASAGESPRARTVTFAGKNPDGLVRFLPEFQELKAIVAVRNAIRARIAAQSGDGERQNGLVRVFETSTSPDRVVFRLTQEGGLADVGIVWEW
jgi:hypothetical protein